MRSTHWLWWFWLALLADLTAIFYEWGEVRYVSKPLIVLSLLAYFLSQPKTFPRIGTLFTAALIFSVIGDVSLLFEDRDPLFFMAGLGSFLVAHILYISAFISLRNLFNRRRQEHAARSTSNLPSARFPRLHFPWIIVVAIYGSTLLYMLLPYLGQLKVPVAVYAFVLCVMLLAVVHAFPKPYSKPGVICLAGGLLFVISDSVLAINKFYMGFPLAGIVIMFTYACAQYLLTTGLVKTAGSDQTAKFALHSTS